MVVVKDASGNKHELTGRLEKIVMAVIENAGDIVKPTNAKIEFHCAGGSLSATIQKSLEMPRPEA
jgi:hypothetical protein